MANISLLGSALAISVGVAIPTLAQQTGAPPPSPPGATAPGAPSPGGTAGLPVAPRGPSGTLQKDRDAWRSAKLVGARVYNDSGDSVGSISDMFIGDDGKIKEVLISVGGFLGLGAKTVTVPFDQLQFQPSAGNPTAPAVGAPGVVGSPGNPPARAYFSVVLPGATKESLTKMGEVKFTE
jgi:sporulation protein YlmC with PRC-barrel domain